jgi:hypothetical protein
MTADNKIDSFHTTPIHRSLLGFVRIGGDGEGKLA